MFGETTILYIKIWNHSIETTIYKWLFEVPGTFYICNLSTMSSIDGGNSNIFGIWKTPKLGEDVHPF